MDEATHDIREALQNIQLFSDVLRPDQLDQLAEQCDPVFFPSGASLMVHGEPGASMFCIVEGMVSLSLNRGHEFRRLGAGNVVGEMELLTGAPRTATVTALTDVHALEITKAALLELFARSPELIESFEAVLAIRQEMLEQISGNPTAASQRSFAGRAAQAFARLLGWEKRRG